MSSGAKDNSMALVDSPAYSQNCFCICCLVGSQHLGQKGSAHLIPILQMEKLSKTGAEKALPRRPVSQAGQEQDPQMFRKATWVPKVLLKPGGIFGILILRGQLRSGQQAPSQPVPLPSAKALLSGLWHGLKTPPPVCSRQSADYHSCANYFYD